MIAWQKALRTKTQEFHPKFVIFVEFDFLWKKFAFYNEVAMLQKSRLYNKSSGFGTHGCNFMSKKQ